MNAAFLLVMTACTTGADPVQAPPPAAKPGAPAPMVAPAPGGCNDCGGGCGDCGCGHEGFFSRFKGRFHHNDCGCGNDCGCERESCLSKLKGRFHRNDCDCAPANDCGCGREGCLSKLKGLFHRGGDCCDTCNTGCNGCGNGPYAAPIGAPIKGEPVPPPKDAGPKKMPEGKSASIAPQPLTGTLVIEKTPF